jgi:mannose-6-phosphate isomerase-like protein (cupin superfamily)
VGPAEIQLPCTDLAAALDYFVGQLGFRIETIFPADDPTTASLSGYGLRLRLAPGAGDPGVIRLPCATLPPEGERMLQAPNGTRILLVDADPPASMPPFAPAFVLSRAVDAACGPGRAGMRYRDLIPSRLGGRYIASHITLPDGGPVADWVHFHKVHAQMIFCRQGWARLVYEDQGEPFLFSAGDCVLQPPLIRHRVLETSPGFEVVEVSSPALHETLADHDMDLPTGRLDPDRDFGGQVFHHGRAAHTPWDDFGDTGFQARDTGLSRASGGRMNAKVLRPVANNRLAMAASRAELILGFVLSGAAVLSFQADTALNAADAFVIPPGEPWRLEDVSSNLELLLVTAPA